MYQPQIHFNKDIEAAVLGITILEPQAFKRVTIYNRDVFHVTGHQIVYDAIKEMWVGKLPIDLFTVCDYLQRHKKFEHIQNWQIPWYLTKLTQYVVSSTHLEYHCEILKQMYLSRLAMAGKKPPVIRFTLYRWLLKHVDKALIKSTIHLYGLKKIKGYGGVTVRVDSTLLVYFMHLAYPEYTWTTDQGDEYYDKEKIRTMIPKYSILINKGQWL